MSEDKKHGGRTPPPEEFNACTNKRESKFNKFCTQTTGADGKLRVTYSSADGNSAGKDYDTTTEPDGSILSRDYESETRKSMSVKSEVGSERKQQKNQCDTTDDNSDRNTLGCSKETVKEEKGEEAGKNRSSAVGGNRTDITKGVHNDVTPPGSKNNRNQITSGNINRKHTGSETTSLEGDLSHHTGKSRYDTIGGEYGIHLPSGNMDCQLDSGRARISASQEILLICGSSYVKILPNKIEIVATRIDLNP
jgi:hypothetical protein